MDKSDFVKIKKTSALQNKTKPNQQNKKQNTAKKIKRQTTV